MHNHWLFKLIAWVWIGLGAVEVILPFCPPSYSEHFYSLKYIPHWHWYVWVIGLLAFGLVAVFEGGHLQVELLKAKYGSTSAKIEGEILEFYPLNSLFSPDGVEYSLIVRVYLVSRPPVRVGLKLFRLETVFQGKQCASDELTSSRQWQQIVEKPYRRGKGVSQVEKQIFEVMDIRDQTRGIVLENGQPITGWLAFIFRGLVGDVFDDAYAQDKFDASKTFLVIIDAFGGEHRLAVKPNFRNTGDMAFAG